MGCRWGIVYEFAAITCLLLALNAIILTLGVWFFKARMAGLCLGTLLGCLNLASLVTTGVFRFNTMGKLAALSLTPSKYDSDAS